jgi:hypothetical protein
MVLPSSLHGDSRILRIIRLGKIRLRNKTR